jgi:NAD-dependent deacetylase
MDPRVDELIAGAAGRPGKVVFLTGAGISAESGIPTFRGEEGYWRVGSRNYRPQELATRAAFGVFPDQIWGWYLYRRTVCRAARPNAAHLALVRLEQVLGDRFVLVTQNVDGLHLRAGNSLRRTWQIHGNIDFMRCADDCSRWLGEIPDGFEPWERERAVDEPERHRLRCPHCRGGARPHVLWFDESYDEEFYYWNSSLGAAAQASLFVVVGTSGATNLPSQMAGLAAARGVPFLVVNAEPSPFSELARRSPSGAFLEGAAGEHLPALVAGIERAFAPR